MLRKLAKGCREVTNCCQDPPPPHYDLGALVPTQQKFLFLRPESERGIPGRNSTPEVSVVS